MMDKNIIMEIEKTIQYLKLEILEKEYLLDQLLANLENKNDNI